VGLVFELNEFLGTCSKFDGPNFSKFCRMAQGCSSPAKTLRCLLGGFDSNKSLYIEQKPAMEPTQENFNALVHHIAESINPHPERRNKGTAKRSE
jgi:hypothetical protein